MQSPPIPQAEIDRRIAPHLDELLKLWWAEQGTEKTRDLALIAAALPFPTTEPLRVLDLCCGPGDVGRAVRARFAQAHVDFVDRDHFLTAICRAANLREGVAGRTLVHDLEDQDWHKEFPAGYDAIVTANALHWFDLERARQLLTEVYGLLRSGGVFLFVEPTDAAKPFTAAFEAWKSAQPSRYSRKAWEAFWFRGNEVLGYDHIKLLGSRDEDRIGDTGMTVADWIALAENAGFKTPDVLLRDADEVLVAAVKA